MVCVVPVRVSKQRETKAGFFSYMVATLNTRTSSHTLSVKLIVRHNARRASRNEGNRKDLSRLQHLTQLPFTKTKDGEDHVLRVKADAGKNDRE